MLQLNLTIKHGVLLCFLDIAIGSEKKKRIGLGRARTICEGDLAQGCAILGILL
jgi:hypothetical protein